MTTCAYPSFGGSPILFGSTGLQGVTSVGRGSTFASMQFCASENAADVDQYSVRAYHTRTSVSGT